MQYMISETHKIENMIKTEHKSTYNTVLNYIFINSKSIKLFVSKQCIRTGLVVSNAI